MDGYSSFKDTCIELLLLVEGNSVITQCSKHSIPIFWQTKQSFQARHQEKILMVQSSLEAKVILREWHYLTQIWNISPSRAKIETEESHERNSTRQILYSLVIALRNNRTTHQHFETSWSRKGLTPYSKAEVWSMENKNSLGLEFSPLGRHPEFYLNLDFSCSLI